MALIELRLFGEVINKVDIAISRLKSFEPPEGYYLAFSGGKDSIVIYKLAEMSGVKFDAHFNYTTVDPPEVVRFIRENYPSVEIHRPKESMFKLIVKNRFPPTRIARYCCVALKERGGAGRFVVTGIRWAESHKRTGRKMVHTCYKDKHKKYLHPIIDWSDAEIWEFIKKYNLKYCCLYDKGYRRIGCVLCPLKSYKDRIRDIKRYPNFYRAYLKAFREMLNVIKSEGRSTIWKDENDVMKWWLYSGTNRKLPKNNMQLIDYRESEEK